MDKRQLINEIYQRVPSTCARINKSGEHVIEFKAKKMLMHATLEKMSIDKLIGVAKMLRLSKIVSQMATI